MSEIWTAVYLFLLSPLVQGRGLKLTVAVLIGIVLGRPSCRGVD